MYITAQGCRLRNVLYCVEWDVKLYYTIPPPPPQFQFFLTGLFLWSVLGTELL